MDIKTLFQQLSYGELSNLALASDGNGTIQTSAHTKLVQYVNEALLRLHSRFVLIENGVLVEQVGSITSYPLLPQYAESNTASLEAHKFIKDSGTPFQNDVIKILVVSDASGFIFPLNDAEDPNSLFTPRMNTLQVPIPQNGVALHIAYQARHPELLSGSVITDTALLDQTFDIPFTFEGALRNYVAHLTFSHMNGQENIVKSQEYLAKDETICAEIEKMDLAGQTISTTNTNFENRGWV